MSIWYGAHVADESELRLCGDLAGRREIGREPLGRSVHVVQLRVLDRMLELLVWISGKGLATRTLTTPEPIRQCTKKWRSSERSRDGIKPNAIPNSTYPTSTKVCVEYTAIMPFTRFQNHKVLRLYNSTP